MALANIPAPQDLVSSKSDLTKSMQVRLCGWRKRCGGRCMYRKSKDGANPKQSRGAVFGDRHWRCGFLAQIIPAKSNLARHCTGRLEKRCISFEPSQQSARRSGSRNTQLAMLD